MTRCSATLLIITCLFWPGALFARDYTQQEYLALISRYVDKVVNIYDGNWAYSYTSHDLLEEETLTWRRDPSRPFVESDQLIAVNQAPPTADRLARHEKRMQRRLRRRQESQRKLTVEEQEARREGSEKERFLSLIIPESIRLVKQEGDIHVIEFRGMEEDRQTVYEHLVGTLVLDTRQGYIKELQVRVTEPFSTFLVMKINSGYFSLRFALVDGLPVQTDATWQLDGHILYVRDLDRNEEFEWFDLSPLKPAENSQGNSP